LACGQGQDRTADLPLFRLAHPRGDARSIVIWADAVQQGFSLVQPPGMQVGIGEVIAGGQGIGVDVAQHPLGVGEGALVQWDGLVHPPGGPVGIGEVAAGGQRIGVGVAQRPLGVGEGALEQRNGLVQPVPLQNSTRVL
jgi:hypothetical protein